MTTETKRTYSTEGPQCPHCGRQYVADDPDYYDEYRYTNDECDECGKPFLVTVTISASWACREVEEGEIGRERGDQHE